MIVLLFICLLTTLYPCHSAMTKMRTNYSEGSLFLFISSIAYVCVFLYGICTRVFALMGYSADVQFAKQTYVMASQLGYGEGMLKMGIYITTLFVSGINICLGVLISRTKSPITYSLLFLILTVCFISIVFTLITGTFLLTSFFVVCCGIMSYFAFVMELTYKEFCVLGNIYLQATLCMMSTIAPLLLTTRQRKESYVNSKQVFCSLNAVIHGIIYIVICYHYWLPLEEGFDLCYKELNQLASITGLSYIAVNIIIFVILFVTDILFNSFVYKTCKAQVNDIGKN